MVKCHLSEIMGKKKIRISQIAKDTGINRSTLTLLYNETAIRVSLPDIEILCKYLDIDISDLFSFSND